MEAENFLQALTQAMSPKAHDAIDNAISSNNRMKFEGGGKVEEDADFYGYDDTEEWYANKTYSYPWSPQFFIDRGDETILDIIKGIEEADIAGMDKYTRAFLDQAIQHTGQFTGYKGRLDVPDFSSWNPKNDWGPHGGLDTYRENVDVARLVDLVGRTMGDFETGPALAKHLGNNNVLFKYH